MGDLINRLRSLQLQDIEEKIAGSQGQDCAKLQVLKTEGQQRLKDNEGSAHDGRKEGNLLLGQRGLKIEGNV